MASCPLGSRLCEPLILTDGNLPPTETRFAISRCGGAWEWEQGVVCLQFAEKTVWKDLYWLSEKLISKRIVLSFDWVSAGWRLSFGAYKESLLLRLFPTPSLHCCQGNQSKERVIANKRSFKQTLLNTESRKLGREALEEQQKAREWGGAGT